MNKNIVEQEKERHGVALVISAKVKDRNGAREPCRKFHYRIYSSSHNYHGKSQEVKYIRAKYMAHTCITLDIYSDLEKLQQPLPSLIK